MGSSPPAPRFCSQQSSQGFSPSPRGAVAQRLAPCPAGAGAAVTQGESTRPSAPPLYLPATEAAALDLSRFCQHSQRPSWRLGTGGPRALLRHRLSVGAGRSWHAWALPLGTTASVPLRWRAGGEGEPLLAVMPGGAPLVAAAARRGLIRAAAVLSPARPSAAGSGAARRAAEKYARLI